MKIDLETQEALEPKGLTTTAFRQDRHRERKVVFSEKDGQRLQDVLGFRALTAVRRQKEGYQPTEIDVFSAEIAALLKKGESLNDLTPQQIAQAYFCLREIADDPGHPYYEWTGLGKKTMGGTRLKIERWWRVKRLTAQLERRMTGETGWRRILRLNRNQRERLYLEELIKKHGDKPRKIEEAMANFSQKEVQKVLKKQGKRIEEDKIVQAEQSVNKTERKFALLARNIAGLIEKGFKKRREIQAWQTTDDLRRFLSEQIKAEDLTDLEIIRFILENNENLLPPATGDEKIEERIEQYLQNIQDASSSEEEVREKIKEEADKLVKKLVSESSFITVTDTLIHIIDRKLPEIDLLAQKEAKLDVPEPELNQELANMLKTSEVVLMLAEGKTEEEMREKGVGEDLIAEARKKYFYQDKQGWHLKKVASKEKVEREREEKLGELEEDYQEEIDNEIDKIALEQAEQDLKELKRDYDKYAKEIKELYDRTIGVEGRSPIEKIATQREITIRGSKTADQILKDEELVAEVEKIWIRLRGAKNRGNTKWRENEGVKKEAWKRVIKNNTEIEKKAQSLMTQISSQELAELGEETVAVLLKEDKVKGGEEEKKVLEEVSEKTREIIEQIENGKTDEAAAALSKRKEKISTAFWLVLIVLGVIDWQGLVRTLEQAGQEGQAQEISSFWG